MASPEIQLVGIGTVSGNINARQAAVNTLDLLAIGGMHDVAVVVGAMDLRRGRSPAACPTSMATTVSAHIELPHTDKQPEAESAHEMPVRLANEYPGELEVIAIGPPPTWPRPRTDPTSRPTRFVRSRSWEEPR